MKKTMFNLMIALLLMQLSFSNVIPIQSSINSHQHAQNPPPSYPAINVQSTKTDDSGWMIECVDCPKQFEAKSNRSMQLDAAGHPHLVYGGDHLYYARYNGSDWFIETINDAPGVGWNASLALDGQSDPHVLYQDFVNSTLKYAFAGTSGWQTQTIDSGEDGSLSLDSTGHPHIVYENQTGLVYAYLEGSEWFTQTVDTAGKLGSLVLDSYGNAQLSYFDTSGVELHYASLEASGWVTQTVSDESLKYTNVLAVDQSGRAHIIYTTIDWIGLTKFPLLMYATPGTNGWQIDTVDTGLVNPSISLELDLAGRPHLIYNSFSDSLTKHLTYAFRDADGWQIEETSIQDGEGLSLALDASGTPRLSYYVNESPSRELRFVYLDNQGWQVQTVDTAGQAGWNNALGLTTAGAANISYFNYAQNGLMFASNASGSWQIQPLSDAGGSNPSMALDGADYPHISYDADLQRMYTYQDDTGWHSEIIDKAMDAEGALILDDAGLPHILYNKEESGPKYYYAGLVHAFLIDDSWQMDWVADPGDSISLAWNEDGLHLSYISAGLIYAGQLIDAAAVGGVSLALDRDGIPHLSYAAWDEDYYALRYASPGQTYWYTQTLDILGNWNTSLALDHDGYPHISYAGGSAEAFEGVDLKYAFQDLTGWHFRTVYHSKIGDSALRLDAQDNPHISFFESFPSADLKYAQHLGPFYEISLSGSDNRMYGLPGTSLTITINLTNTGQAADTFEIVKTGNQWETALPATTGSLAVGESFPLDIKVTIPPTATLGSSDTATITLTSQSDPTVSASATLTTYAAITTYLPLVSK